MADRTGNLSAAPDPRMRRRLVTPEGVDLGLTLAGMGQRMAAFMLDMLIILTALIVGAMIASAIAAAAPGTGRWLVKIVWTLGAFLLRSFYFTLMEMGPRAATFGKRICGLRVVARGGGRLTADAVIARNLTREVEYFLPLTFLLIAAGSEGAGAAMWLAGLGWTLLFLLFPLFNRDRLRVGDLLAGTWVINVPKRELGLDLVRPFDAAAGFAFTDAQLDAYGQFELQTLEGVLRRSEPEAIATVSATIRDKIGYGEVGDDYAFLSLYYQALRARLERKLLFGKRRRDKFDLSA